MQNKWKCLRREAGVYSYCKPDFPLQPCKKINNKSHFHQGGALAKGLATLGGKAVISPLKLVLFSSLHIFLPDTSGEKRWIGPLEPNWGVGVALPL